MDAFTAPKKEDAANWGLGWWREGDNQRCWYFGTQAPSNTIGHQGWTGTLTMIDPVENLVVVYLTNKINSPVTDKAANPNKFNGNWYTASTLGFVAQLLYQGLQNHGTDPNNAYSALLEDMAESKFALVAEGRQRACHPPAGALRLCRAGGYGCPRQCHPLLSGPQLFQRCSHPAG